MHSYVIAYLLLAVVKAVEHFMAHSFIMRNEGDFSNSWKIGWLQKYNFVIEDRASRKMRMHYSGDLFP